MMILAKMKVAAAGVGLVLVGGIIAAVGIAGNGPATQAAATQPATIDGGVTPIGPGEKIPDAAALVREVRQAESWIDTVRTFRVQAQGKWTRTPEQIEARRAELQKQFPQTAIDAKSFPELRPETDDRLELVFDDHRLYKRNDSPNGSRLMDVRVWDGKQAIIYERYPTREYYALDKDPARSIGRFFLQHLCWPRSGPHPFWWLPEPERQGNNDFFGQPGEFICVGREQFRGTACYVLERDLYYWQLHVGIDDHRLYAIERRQIPSSKEDHEATPIIIQLALDHGQHFNSSSQYYRWVVSLPADERKAITKEYFRRLRPMSAPDVMFWFADYREVMPGCWMPMTQGQRNFKLDTPGVASADITWKITSAQANQALPDELFTLQLEEGVDVNDWGHKPPLFYKYKKDRTPDEWKAIYEEANQRQANDEAAKAERDELIGKPAPEFPETQWLQSRPLTLSDLKGKVVLVDFFADWCGPCRNDFDLLTTLHKGQKENGLTIIAIHPAGSEMAAIEKVLKEFSLAYPVCVDTASEETWGTLYGQYRIGGIPYTFVLDREGKIAAHGSLQETLPKALELAESKR